MQRQPCRRLEYDPQTRALARVQYVYSAILRSLGCAEAPKDPTKRLIDWRRLIVWTSRDMCTGQTTMVVLRCPNETQERLMNVMSTGGEYQRRVLRHPMLVHAFFAEDVYTSSMDFSREFAAPMYGLELDIGRSAAEYTQRARRFMLMARQMGNVMIDYDIYLASLKLLQEISLLMRESKPPIDIDNDEWHRVHQDFDGKMFEHVYADIDLLKRYGHLYEQRTIIGNSEVLILQFPNPGGTPTDLINLVHGLGQSARARDLEVDVSRKHSNGKKLSPRWPSTSYHSVSRPCLSTTVSMHKRVWHGVLFNEFRPSRPHQADLLRCRLLVVVSRFCSPLHDRSFGDRLVLNWVDDS